MSQTEFDTHGSFIRWSDLPGRLPARVFIHGLGGTGWAAFGHIAGHLALRGHRSLVIDLPGHGLSDRPVDWGYSLDDHASAVAMVCAAAGVEGMDLVGHSLGADIAVTVAGRNPGLVGRLVIAEANLDPLPRSATGGRMSQRIAAQAEDAFVATGFRECVEGNPDWAPTLRLCDPVAVYRSAVGLVTGTRPTMRDMLTALTIERTFVRGDHGETLNDAEGLTAAGVDVVTIGDAGHVMMADQPTAFVEALAAALPDRPTPS
jgi:pimeloyl-ACP methyl ester carboxylesterase